MTYSLILFLNQIWTYIHKLTQRSEKLVEPIPEEKPDKGISIGKAFRMVVASEYETIYSSDKSLIRATTYGGGIDEFIEVVSKAADALLLDKSFDHDRLLLSRAEVYVRDIFFTREGKFVDPVDAILQLKGESIRLADGYELRKSHPTLGVNTFNNCQTADLVLRDLDKFFKESCDGYREFRTLRGARVYFG